MDIKYNLAKKVLGDENTIPLQWYLSAVIRNRDKTHQTIICAIDDILQKIDKKVLQCEIYKFNILDKHSFEYVQKKYHYTPIISYQYPQLIINHYILITCILAQNEHGHIKAFIQFSDQCTIQPISSQLDFITLLNIYHIVVELALYPSIVRVFKQLMIKTKAQSNIVIPITDTTIYLFNTKEGNLEMSYNNLDKFTYVKKIDAHVMKLPIKGLLTSQQVLIVYSFINNYLYPKPIPTDIKTKINQLILPQKAKKRTFKRINSTRLVCIPKMPILP